METSPDARMVGVGLVPTEGEVVAPGDRLFLLGTLRPATLSPADVIDGVLLGISCAHCRATTYRKNYPDPLFVSSFLCNIGGLLLC